MAQLSQQFGRNYGEFLIDNVLLIGLSANTCVTKGSNVCRLHVIISITSHNNEHISELNDQKPKITPKITTKTTTEKLKITPR